MPDDPSVPSLGPSNKPQTSKVTSTYTDLQKTEVSPGEADPCGWWAIFRFFAAGQGWSLPPPEVCRGHPASTLSRVWLLHVSLVLSVRRSLSSLHPPSCSSLTATLGGDIIFPALEKKKLRHREGERLAQGHTAVPLYFLQGTERACLSLPRPGWLALPALLTHSGKTHLCLVTPHCQPLQPGSCPLPQVNTPPPNRGTALGTSGC